MGTPLNAARGGGRSRRIIWWVLIAAVMIGIASMGLFGQGIGRSYLSCAMCGAKADCEHLFLLGVGLTFDWRVQEGPIAKFIQNGKSCAHSWELAGPWRTSPLTQFNGSGGGLRRSHWVNRLELATMSRSDASNIANHVLELESRADPYFRSKLSAAIASSARDDDSLSLLESVEAKMLQATCATSMPVDKNCN